MAKNQLSAVSHGPPFTPATDKDFELSLLGVPVHSNAHNHTGLGPVSCSEWFVGVKCCMYPVVRIRTERAHGLTVHEYSGTAALLRTVGTETRASIGLC